MGVSSGNIVKSDKLLLYLDAANSHSYIDGSTTCECLVSQLKGTLENGTSFSPINGGGWVFGGGNDYIDFGNGAAGMNPKLDSFTLNIFFKIGINSTSSSIIASKGNGADSDIGWLIYYSDINGILTVRCNGDNTSSERAAQHISIDKGQNYMVTMVINRTDNTVKGYLNGSNIGWVNGNYAGTFSGNSISGFGSITNSDSFLIGENPQLNLPMIGTIYMIQSYSFALSELEIYKNLKFFNKRYDLKKPFLNTYSFLLDGTDDYLKTDSTFSTLDGATYLSMSFWVRVDSLSTTQMFIGSTEDSYSYQTSVSVDTAGMIQANIANNGSNWTRSATGAITVGNWHHVVVTLDNTINRYSKLKIFVDGTQSVGGSNFYNAVIGNGVDLYLGSSETPSLFLDGNMDEVSIWGNHTLTPSEISTLYNNGTPTNLGKFSTPPQNWWRMGEDSVWNSSEWVMPDKIGSNVVKSFNMAEASRVRERPPMDDKFKMTVKTDNVGTSLDDQFYLKLANGTTNVTVDWGDGTSDVITTWNQAELTHTYPANGSYQISMDGAFYGFTFQYSDHLKVMSIDNWGNNAFGWMSRSFWGCTNLIGTYTDIPNTSAVTSFNQTFKGCTNFNSPVEFDTSSTTDMNGMFWLATAFNQPVAFDTSKVTTMYGMFRSTGAFNQTINFDGSAVTTTSNMFGSAAAMTSPVTITNSTLLTDCSSMFAQMGVFNAAVTLTTTNVTTMASMFAYARYFSSTLTLNGGTANVTNFQNMFYLCKLFNQPVPYDTSSATNMGAMFRDCQIFDQSLNTFDTSLVTHMAQMFESAFAFNQDISHFVTTNVTNMSGMFKRATAFNQTINFDGSSLTTASYMFSSAALMTGDVTITNSTLLTDCTGMFGQMGSFNGNVTLTTSAVTNMSTMFAYGASLDSTVSTITFNGGTANVTNFYQMFYRCSLFNQPVTFLDTSSATSLQSMFQEAFIFNQSVSHFNTTNVAVMQYMFFKTYLFDQDVSSFNISNLTNAIGMFQVSGFLQTNYDLLLVAWDAQATSNVSFHAGNAQYTAPVSAPDTARAAMIARGWTIIDGGPV